MIHPHNLRKSHQNYIKRSVAESLAPIVDTGVNIKSEIFKRYYPHADIDTTIFRKISNVTPNPNKRVRRHL